MRKNDPILEIKAKTKGNPGRPRKILSITENIREHLIRNPYMMQNLVKAILDLAIKRGNIQAIQEIMNRIDGKVIERHEVENKQSVTLIFQPVDTPKQLEPVIEGEYRAVDDSESKLLQARTPENDCS